MLDGVLNNSSPSAAQSPPHPLLAGAARVSLQAWGAFVMPECPEASSTGSWLSHGVPELADSDRGRESRWLLHLVPISDDAARGQAAAAALCTQPRLARTKGRIMLPGRRHGAVVSYIRRAFCLDCRVASALLLRTSRGSPRAPLASPAAVPARHARPAGGGRVLG